MLQNPFLTVPQAESPQSRSWSRGLVFGFQSDPASVAEPTDVQSEDPEAFQQGVMAGQQAAINGLDIIRDPCVDLNREGPFPEGAPDTFFGALEGVAALTEVAKLAIAGGLCSSILAFIDFSIGMQTHFDDPEETLSKGASQLQNVLTEMGLTGSMQVFLGGALDFNARGCELRLTPIFRSSEGALAAAQGMGRSKGLTVSWRTDQSGGIDLVNTFG